ncbi:hypothetical protein CANARDRAFT_27856 [[Candida] arabinofermentans NRRL YB-2248]|uniref:Sulfhydryl oxidase n=1 Tax=[Candida] arabinofermentans NRRL YB-2248 TaxID=983967 RepID=A0A1E4T204_9ASCO|nr:hypothetical protein CANARDRAFT_27856 [[Candida] arabinofermentans NRRL YB-2248]
MVTNTSFGSNQLDHPLPISEDNLEKILKQNQKIVNPNQEVETKLKTSSKPPTLAKDSISGYDGDQLEESIPFMPKMANETLKAELGNAAWKLFHTILARYPDEPTTTQKGHLMTYITSFAQVYPCGDCARHFAKLLKKYPPQLSTRTTAAVWGCHVHNKVNEALGKPEYDCTTILEDYDCGCGSDEEQEDSTLGGESISSVSGKGKSSKKRLESEANHDESLSHLTSIQVESTENNVGG